METTPTDTEPEDLDAIRDRMLNDLFEIGHADTDDAAEDIDEIRRRVLADFEQIGDFSDGEPE